MIFASTITELKSTKNLMKIDLIKGLPVMHMETLRFVPSIYMAPANRKDMRLAQQDPYVSKQISKLQSDEVNAEAIEAGEALNSKILTLTCVGLVRDLLTQEDAEALERTLKIKDIEERAIARKEILQRAVEPSSAEVLRLVPKDFDREELLQADYTRLVFCYNELNHVKEKEEVDNFFGPAPF